MLKNSGKLLGAGALFSAAVIYATFGLFIRESSEMFGQSAQVAIRFALAALIVLAFLAIRRKPLTLPKADLLRVLGLGVVFAILVILFTISVNETKIANSVFLLYAGSIISSLLIGTLFLKEKLSVAKVVAIVIALCGLAMYADTFIALSLGIVTAFASGLLDGVGNAIRKTLKGVDRSLVIMYSYGLGAIVALAVALVSGEHWVSGVSLGPIVAMLVFVGLMIGISNLLLYGFQHFDVNVGTVILACELLFATFLGYLFFSESPTSRELIGGTLIFAASALTIIDTRTLLARFGWRKGASSKKSVTR